MEPFFRKLKMCTFVFVFIFNKINQISKISKYEIENNILKLQY